MQQDLCLKTNLCYIKNSILNQPRHCVVKNLVKCLAGLWDKEKMHETYHLEMGFYSLTLEP